MPRLRKYASAIVPEIGCDMAKRRRADSGDPAGTTMTLDLWHRFGSGRRQAEKAPGLIGDIAKVGEAAAFADDIEQIAMIAGRGVGPFAGGALAGFQLRSAGRRESGRVYF